jgi:hypothetical protein
MGRQHLDGCSTPGDETMSGFIYAVGVHTTALVAAHVIYFDVIPVLVELIVKSLA